ncbi:MAG: hypothetical protein AB8B44_08295 [Prochlorococcus sp.]
MSTEHAELNCHKGRRQQSLAHRQMSVMEVEAVELLYVLTIYCF